MEKKYLRLEDIDAYKTAYNLSNYIWGVVMSWDKFPRWTVGKQLVDAADSVPANLAEGWGRFYTQLHLVLCIARAAPQIPSRGSPPKMHKTRCNAVYKKEKIQFYRYSNGSREECQNWIKKS